MTSCQTWSDSLEPYTTRLNAFDRSSERIRLMDEQMSSLASAHEIMAGARFVRILDDRALPRTEIIQLFIACFGEVDTLWPANQRWLLWSSDRLLGHVSVQRRWFVVNERHLEGWFVGGVCIDPAFQRSGIGTLLMRQAHTDLASQTLNFAVLNCGAPLICFYERVGYSKVSDRALYIRDGRLELDDDPALATSFKRGFDIATLVCEAFPFGFDF